MPMFSIDSGKRLGLALLLATTTVACDGGLPSTATVTPTIETVTPESEESDPTGLPNNGSVKLCTVMTDTIQIPVGPKPGEVTLETESYSETDSDQWVEVETVKVYNGIGNSKFVSNADVLEDASKTPLSHDALTSFFDNLSITDPNYTYRFKYIECYVVIDENGDKFLRRITAAVEKVSKDNTSSTESTKYDLWSDLRSRQ